MDFEGGPDEDATLKTRDRSIFTGVRIAGFFVRYEASLTSIDGRDGENCSFPLIVPRYCLKDTSSRYVSCH